MSSEHRRKIRILHTEVGGSYGGSLRALEVYLAHSDRTRFEHDLLLYYPSPGAERIECHVGRLWTLGDRAPRAVMWHRAPVLAPPRRVLKSLIGEGTWSDLMGWRSLLAHPGIASRLVRTLGRGPYDVVHVNNTFTYQPWTLLAAQLTGKPVVAHVRNPVPPGPFSRVLMRMADRLVTVNRSFETQLNSWDLPVLIRTVHDGAEPPIFDESASKSLRASIVPPGGILVGSAGRLDTQKGYEDLVYAARRIVDRRPEVHFAIAGEGPLRGPLEALIARLGVTDNFHLCGFRTDVADFLSGLDVFVSSSLWEGLPLAVVEAMHLGIPVIATAAGGSPEVVIPGHTGELVPVHDVDALATAISKVLSDMGAAKAQTHAARLLAASISDPVASAQTLDDLLSDTVIIRDPGTRGFYDRAYSTSAWSRPADVEAPGVRFTKMWYRAFEDHILPTTRWNGTTVLEVGCGYGHLAPVLRRLGATYTGVDISLNAVRQLPVIEGVHTMVADGRHLPFPSATFDKLVCMEVLEHVTDPDILVAECARVVRPGGFLIVSCPNYLNLFLIPKLLADLGLPMARRYIRRQLIDRTTTAFGVRRLLSRRGAVQLQRAVRLHPPLFEQIDYRLSEGRLLKRLNDMIFAIEARWGNRAPLNYLGLHTLFVVRMQGAANHASRREVPRVTG